VYGWILFITIFLNQGRIKSKWGHGHKIISLEFLGSLDIIFRICKVFLDVLISITKQASKIALKHITTVYSSKDSISQIKTEDKTSYAFTALGMSAKIAVNGIQAHAWTNHRLTVLIINRQFRHGFESHSQQFLLTYSEL